MRRFVVTISHHGPDCRSGVNGDCRLELAESGCAVARAHDQDGDHRPLRSRPEARRHGGFSDRGHRVVPPLDGWTCWAFGSYPPTTASTTRSAPSAPPARTRDLALLDRRAHSCRAGRRSSSRCERSSRRRRRSSRSRFPRRSTSSSSSSATSFGESTWLRWRRRWPAILRVRPPARCDGRSTRSHAPGSSCRSASSRPPSGRESLGAAPLWPSG